MNVGNDGKTAVVEARGDVFVAPSDNNIVKDISNTPGTREMYPQISPDGKEVAFSQTKPASINYIRNRSKAASGNSSPQLSNG